MYFTIILGVNCTFPNLYQSMPFLYLMIQKQQNMYKLTEQFSNGYQYKKIKLILVTNVLSQLCVLVIWQFTTSISNNFG